MSDLSLLVDMGFSEAQAEKALSVTGNKGVEPAMEWLLSNSESIAEITSQVAPIEKMEEEESAETDAVVKSLACDICGRHLKSDSEVEYHALKTGHDKFSESTEDIKPLTAEEKQEQIKKVESLIKLRRAEKAEEEKRQEVEKEKNRRKTGQEMTLTKQRMQEQEMKALAEQKRKEKQEEKQARQRVLEAIERDKEARRIKYGGGAAPTAAPPTQTPPLVTPTAAPSYEECKLQIRLSNGDSLSHTFGSKEELSAVRLYVELNRTDGSAPFSLMTNFPRKVFSEEDMRASLTALGLVPSSVIILTRPQ